MDRTNFYQGLSLSFLTALVKICIYANIDRIVITDFLNRTMTLCGFYAGLVSNDREKRKKNGQKETFRVSERNNDLSSIA